MTRERSKRGRPIRALATTLAFLVAGFVLQSLVAWYTGLNPRAVLPVLPERFVRPPADSRTDAYVVLSDRDLQRVYLCRRWESPGVTQWSVFGYGFSVDPETLVENLGYSPVIEPEEFDAPTSFTIQDMFEGRVDRGRFYAHATGWPLRSYYVATTPGPEVSVIEGALFDRSLTPEWIASNEMRFKPNSALTGLVPGGLMPVGAAANTSMYAAAMWTVCCTPLLVFRAFRRRSRCKRGLCTACGYDLSAVVGIVCPECGTGIRHAGRTAVQPPASARERVPNR